MTDIEATTKHIAGTEGCAVPNDPWTTPERLALSQLARSFVAREITPKVTDWEEAGEIPRELHRKAADVGLLGVGFPENVGGSGGDAIDSALVTEAILACGGSTGVCAALFTHGIALPHIAANGSDALIDHYVRPTLAGDMIGSLAVTEPGAGSDVANLRTRAVRDGDTYVVNGAKTFITSGVRADFVTTAVRTGDPGTAEFRCWLSTRAHRGSRLTAGWTRWDGVAAIPQNSRSLTFAFPLRTWWGQRTADSCRSCSSFSRNDSALPCRHTRRRSARSN